MAKETPAKEEIIIPHGLELDPDCVPIASDDESVTVERNGKKWRITASNHPAVAWDWFEVSVK